MELDFDLHQAFDEAVDALQNVCPKCHKVVFGNYCSNCKTKLPNEKYYDPDWEDYASAVEAENDEYFKNLEKPDSWTEVKDEEDLNA
jgi:hypothetical protein